MYQSAMYSGEPRLGRNNAACSRVSIVGRTPTMLLIERCQRPVFAINAIKGIRRTGTPGLDVVTVYLIGDREETANGMP